jgi:hypothetical protein
MASVVVIAATHSDSLVSKAYYEDEIRFQTTMEATARAQKAGATLKFDAATSQLVITVPREHLTQKITGKVELFRPSAMGLDREFLLEVDSTGRQALNLSKLASGLWRARVTWTAGGQNYRLEEKINLAGK